MKKHFFDRTRIAMATMIAVAVLIILGACSTASDKFIVDARFLNMNQAAFYVYSPDGVIDGIDTINVNGGRFTYEHAIDQEGTIVIVFPNYAVMPVFVEPGADITIEANAAHLRQMEITGTESNKMYTEWRKNTESLSPPEMKKHAEQFINEHPESPVARWMLRHFFIESENADLTKAKKLLKTMLKATDNGIQVAKMSKALSRVGELKVGDRLPRFTAKDINGNPVTNGALLKGNTVICLWATWNYESMNMVRMLANNMRSETAEYKVDHVVAICMDPSEGICRSSIRQNDMANLTVICDTMMWDSPLLTTLGLSNIPDNIKLRDGKVIARSVASSELTRK